MARYSASDRATGPGAVGLPLSAITAAAGSGGSVREVEVVNLTSNTVELKLIRLFAAGTPGAALSMGKYSLNRNSPQMTVFNTYSASPAGSQDAGYSTMLPAIPGVGEIWGFGDTGYEIPAGTANGLGICVACGVGQLTRFRYTWDE